MREPITKESQLKHNKKAKVKTFNKRKVTQKEAKDYYEYLHSSNQKCVICGGADIELHHISDLKKLPKEPRRDNKRLVVLCKNHHKDSKKGIHIMSKEEFYSTQMQFLDLMFHSKRLYKEFLSEK